MATEFINPDTAWDAKPRGYSHVVKVSKPENLYFVSGAAAINNDMEVQHLGDIEGQTRLVFEHIKRDLEAAGSSMDEIVKMTVYVTDEANAWPIRNVRKEFFDPQKQPASTMIAVKGFVIEGMLIEIDAIAASY